MKITVLAAFFALLAGCATPPMRMAAPRTKVVLTERAFDEISTARTRELAFHALSHIGVPYRYGGTHPDTGFDCSGLVQYVYRRGAGVALPRNTQALSAVGAPVPPNRWSRAISSFSTPSADRIPTSGSISAIGASYMHPTGGHVELVDMRERYWQSRFNGARRLDL